MNDPLADMLTRIRNAQLRGKSSVPTPSSKLRDWVLDVLADEGHIRGYEKTVGTDGHPAIEISLKHIPGIVVNAAALIVPVAEGDGGLYRARFVGVSWRQAQRACKILTRKRLDCEVVQHFFESETLALAT